MSGERRGGMMMRLSLLGVICGTLLLAPLGAQAAEFELPAPVVAPAIPEGASTKPVNLAKVQFDIAPDAAWGEFRGGLLCLPYGKLSWPPKYVRATQENFAAIFRRDMLASGFSDGGEDMFATDTSLPGEYIVGARVKSARGRVCSWLTEQGDNLQKAAIALDVDWQVYSKVQRKTVATISTTGGARHESFRTDSEARALLDAFGQNAKALAATPEFRALFVTTAASTPEPVAEDRGAIKFTAVRPGPPMPISERPGSVVAVFATGGMGSAFLISEEGYMITNEHVVGTDKTVRVRWSDGFETEAKVLRSHKLRDIALVQTSARGRTPFTLRASGARPGETVLAIGAPLDAKFQGTLTKGIVSANRIFDGFSFIQSDVTVNHGNSGGPLLDEKGQVIGITDLGYQPDGVPTGINLFIPIGDALDFLNLKPAP